MKQRVAHLINQQCSDLILNLCSVIHRLHSSKPPAPPPPQKVRTGDSNGVEVEEEDSHRIVSLSNYKELLKQSQEQANEPQALAFRKLDDVNSTRNVGASSQTKPAGDQKFSLVHNGEKLLATFYGMLYTNDAAEREWKLEVEGFIPVCFVQVRGNALNKPFKIIAVEKSRRVRKLITLLIHSFEMG